MDEAPLLLVMLGNLGAVLGAARMAGNVLHWRWLNGRGLRVGAALDAVFLSRFAMLAVVIGSFWLGVHAVIAFFAAVSVVALRQFMTAAGVSPGDDAHARSDRLLHVAVILVQYALVSSRAYALFSVCIPLASALLLPILSLCGRSERRPLDCIAKRHWAIMLCVYCVSCAPALLMLEIPGFAGKNALLLIFFVVVTQAADVCERLVSRLRGPTAPAHKSMRACTLERCVGRGAGAIAAGCALCALTPFPMLVAGAMGLALALSGLLGITVMAAIRRDSQFKTRGLPLAARSETMDRLGCLCFSAPVLLQLTHFLYAA